MVKFELGGEEEKRDRREGRGGEIDGKPWTGLFLALFP